MNMVNNNNRNRRPQNNQHRRRHSGGSGGGHHQNNNNNRPRRNYGAMREKYLTQARDAMSSGDRVLAEYYLQHADHCTRMLMEEGERFQQQRRSQQSSEDAGADTPTDPMAGEVEIPENNSSLPSFLTAGYEKPAEQIDPASVQSWEERDQ